MRRILVLAMFFPATVAAQQIDQEAVKNEPALIGLLRTVDSPAASDHSLLWELTNSTKNASAQDSLAPGGQKQKPAQTGKKPPIVIERPPADPSMVGYIDDAIIGSEVRIRFDAGFGDDTPDRAEFFYAKCGCYRGLPSNALAHDPNAPGPGPGIVTNLNFQQLYFNIEYALTKRFSVFAEPLVRGIQPQTFAPGTGSFPSHSGIGDLRAGFKLAMLASPDRYLTFQFRTYFPTGDASQGLGTNHYSLEPALLYYQRFSNRLSLESQVGDWIPTGGSAGVASSSNPHPGRFSGNVFFYGVGPSYELYRSERVRFTPVVELVGWSVRGGFQTTTPAQAGGTNIVNIKIGARTGFGAHSSVYVGYGHTLTSADWYNSILRVEYRYTL